MDGPWMDGVINMWPIPLPPPGHFRDRVVIIYVKKSRRGEWVNQINM